MLDTELELAPISAGELLSARAESGCLMDKYGGEDGLCERLCLGACILALGLYDGENRAFSTGDEVLENLTAEEILYAAGEYGYDELADTPVGVRTAEAGDMKGEEPGSFPQKDEKEILPALDSASGLEETVTDAEKKAAAAEDKPDSGPISAAETEATYAALQKRGAEKAMRLRSGRGYDAAAMENVRVLRERSVDDGTESGYNVSRGAAFDSGYGADRDMRALSDFFERDSRRYAGEFVLY